MGDRPRALLPSSWWGKSPPPQCLHTHACHYRKPLISPQAFTPHLAGLAAKQTCRQRNDQLTTTKASGPPGWHAKTATVRFPVAWTTTTAFFMHAIVSLSGRHGMTAKNNLRPEDRPRTEGCRCRELSAEPCWRASRVRCACRRARASACAPSPPLRRPVQAPCQTRSRLGHQARARSSASRSPPRSANQARLRSTRNSTMSSMRRRRCCPMSHGCRSWTMKPLPRLHHLGVPWRR